LLHGGKYFSSGANLTMLSGASDKEAMRKMADTGIKGSMDPYMRALNESNKPIVAVVRGGAAGFGFTTLSLCDFVYLESNALLKTPFMASF